MPTLIQLGGGGGLNCNFFFQTPMSPYLNYAMTLYHHKTTKNLLYTLKTLVQMKHEDNLVLNKLIALDVA